MTWQSGEKLQAGKYIIQKELGEKGFGITYKAQHTLLDSTVVIKTPNRKFRKDPEYPKYVKRFLKEAQTLAKLSAQRHPPIVQVKDLFEEGDIPCLVMEFIEGESLFHFVQRQGVIKESQAINYIQQIGEALSLIHQAGLVHRDAHPGNIMIQNLQNCILIDFGLASEIVPVASSTKHPANVAFAPFEQMFGSCEITVDVYTLAASLYYAVTGEVPTPNIYNRYQGGKLKEPKEFTRISYTLNQAIVKGLEFDPKKRPQTINDWLSMFPSAASLYYAITGEVPTLNTYNRSQGSKLKEPKELTSISETLNQAIERPQTINDWLSMLPSAMTPAAPNVASVPLVSARGVDYQKLRDLLKAGNWKEADEETVRVMLKVANREKEGWLDVEDIDNFPCENLRTIDQLWVKYSHGRFGFSVQKRIYQSLGGTRAYDEKIWRAFGERVGWRVNNNWLDYNDLTFSTKTPEGNFPTILCYISMLGFDDEIWFGLRDEEEVSSLASRLVKCNI